MHLSSKVFVGIGDELMIEHVLSMLGALGLLPNPLPQEIRLISFQQLFLMSYHNVHALPETQDLYIFLN
jgi:hypothetical protein